MCLSPTLPSSTRPSRWNQLDLAIVLLSVMGITLEEIEINAALPINPTIIRIMRVLRIARGWSQLATHFLPSQGDQPRGHRKHQQGRSGAGVGVDWLASRVSHQPRLSPAWSTHSLGDQGLRGASS